MTARHYYHFKTLTIGYPIPISFVIRIMRNGQTIRTENHPVTNNKFPYRTQIHAESQALLWCGLQNSQSRHGGQRRALARGIDRSAG